MASVIQSLPEHLPSATPFFDFNTQRLVLLQGHVLKALAVIPNDTVDLIVTSPPYWGLRDYGEETVTVWDGEAGCEHEWGALERGHHIGQVPQTKNQIASGSEDSGAFCSKCDAWRGQLGLEPSLELYLKHLLQVTAELKRVLKPTGIMFWNQGDSYGGSWQNYGNRPEESGHSDGQRIKNTEYYARGDSVKSWPVTLNATAKCMCLQNYRLLIKLVDEQGWIARNVNIWNKPNHMPSSVKDRFTNGYEPIFMLVKSNDTAYYWNERTGLMADRPPAERIEGRDWEWRICQNCEGKGVITADKKGYFDEDRYEEPPEGGVCRRCDGTGKVKYQFWNSFDYWFDLDAVREEYSFNRWGGRFKTNDTKVKVKPNEKDAGGQGSLNRMNYDCYPHSGKNPGDVIEMTKEEWIQYSEELWNMAARYPDVFTLPTQPFPDAHFAVFPPKLPERFIKCGCPAEICTQCEKARVRITSPSEEYSKKLGSSWHNHEDVAKRGNSRKGLGHLEGLTAEYQTIGWTTCSCANPEYRPGIVLDPFLGKGTTMAVARKMGMSCIGIEISPKYVAMAKKEAAWNMSLSILFDELAV
jgi:DNA modification methylase